ncbi:uncharacterized protein LOC116248635 isoform X6 [Nymphaea colorata]|uniref:uncharacterized protein LOC116248635 isoform X6 n=1 Tax=Nymphaea colorata TaxID=210225 RepID=UPI00129EC1BC|nr:uncharacterized protein LOC116248635 isoform X6 [Nymphaea colorata]
MALIPLLDQLKLQRKLRVVACAVSSPAADSQTEIQIKLQRKLRVVACAVSSPAADSQTEIQIKLQRKLRVVACAVSSPAVDSQTEIQIKRKLRVVACAVSSPAADSQTEIQIKRKLRVVACAVSSPAVDSQTEIQIKVLCFIPSFSFIYFGSLNVEQSRLCLLCYRLSETQVKTKFTLAVEFFMDRSSTWVQKKKFTEPLGSILVSVSRRHR